MSMNLLSTMTLQINIIISIQYMSEEIQKGLSDFPNISKIRSRLKSTWF